MKRFLHIFLTVMCVGCLGMIAWLIADAAAEYARLAATPGTSGVDYLLFGFAQFLGCVVAAAVGCIGSWINYKISVKEPASKAFRLVGLSGFVLFAVGLCAAFMLIYL